MTELDATDRRPTVSAGRWFISTSSPGHKRFDLHVTPPALHLLPDVDSDLNQEPRSGGWSPIFGVGGPGAPPAVFDI